MMRSFYRSCRYCVMHFEKFSTYIFSKICYSLCRSLLLRLLPKPL